MELFVLLEKETLQHILMSACVFIAQFPYQMEGHI
jgi:hypothetical protein